MRTANLVVSGLAVAAVVVAAVVAWRGRRLERIPDTGPPATPGEAALTAVRTLGIGLSAGIAAGFLVVGLGGRLVMRVLAATSGDLAQGRTTEAEELVGEITVDGTIGFILFVGLGGGVAASLLYLLTRRVLPRAAGPAGLVLGVLLVGTLGVQDPLSPDNRDFAILEPLWLAVAADRRHRAPVRRHVHRRGGPPRGTRRGRAALARRVVPARAPARRPDPRAR